MFLPAARGRRQRVGSGRSASTSSAAARSGSSASASMRGLGACCDECAGLGDAEPLTVQQQIMRDWLAILSVGLGLVSVGALVFALDKKRRRRSYRRRRTPITQELPVYETMSDVVWGRRR